MRANRQLAVVLRAQGLNEAADRFAYRAQVLRRRVLRRSGTRAYGPYLFSWLLDVLAGYGYKPGRTLAAYLATVLGFAIIYYVLGHVAGNQPSMSPLYALIISIISFHGRGFFPAGFLPTLPMAVCAACEAIIGLTIEISFIATFTQRYLASKPSLFPTPLSEGHALVPGRLPAWADASTTRNEQCAACF